MKCLKKGLIVIGNNENLHINYEYIAIDGVELGKEMEKFMIILTIFRNHLIR